MRDDRLTVSALVLALALGFGGASLAAETSKPGSKPAKLEAIPGSDLKRVILTQKAAERLAIQTTEVREEPVMRWLTVEGQVEPVTVDAPVVTAAAAATTGSTGVGTASDAVSRRVRVPVLDGADPVIARAVPSLSVGDDDDDDDDDEEEEVKLQKDPDDLQKDPDDNDKPKGTMLLDLMSIGGSRPSTPLKARLEEVVPSAGAAGTAPARYYLVDLDSQNNHLKPGQRVYVRVPQPGSGTPQKVIPHSALIYDPRGNAWTYTNPEPLVFVRHHITVEYIQGDVAVLTEGPPTGTTVVTAGAAQLMGVEQKFGY